MSKRGFTLVELMIVIAIIGIMASMAMPSFQDRVIRAQVSEALSLADIAKDAVEEYYVVQHGQLPKDNVAVSLPAADKIVVNYTTKVEVKDGVVEVTLGNRVNKHAVGKVLALRPAMVEGEPRVPIAWVCGYASVPGKMVVIPKNSTTLERRLLPIECRY